ncbi:MAG: MobC family plasmid mobilization relaxosome protein [Gammaproteobacteria bacterium]|nr:MobC family plasmid mobilization relaxosome protein [Gammaproteobacteria bacterium]
MARPRKQTTEKRPRVVAYRVTDEEQARLEAKANQLGQSIGEYSRRAALRKRVVVQQAAPALSIGAIMELNRIGVNLNQLTRVANTNGNMPTGLVSLLERINVLLDEAMELEDIDEKCADPAEFIQD